MKIKLLYTVFTSVILFFSACEKSFDWQYEDNDIKILVVEGIITNENKIQSLSLSWVRPDPNEAALPITNASVSVVLAGNTYAFVNDTLGVYKSQSAFIGVIDIPVTVEIIIDGVTYTGTDEMIPVTPTQNAEFKKVVSATDTLYELVSPASTFSSTEQAMWEINIDWSALPAYQNTPADSCKARLFYYDLKTIDVSQVFAPGQQNLKFPKGAQVVQTKYALSPEHAQFRRSMLLETEWRGGLFDVSPGTVYTNIKGGAVGFFGASSVVKTSFIIE